MTKIDCSVQILITGPTASGKSLVLARLSETLSGLINDQVYVKSSFDDAFATGANFSVVGDLVNRTPPEPASKVCEELLRPIKPEAPALHALEFYFRVDGETGQLFKFDATQPVSKKCDIVRLLAVDPRAVQPDPVGMDQYGHEIEQALAAGPSGWNLSPSDSQYELNPEGFLSRCMVIEPVKVSGDIASIKVPNLNQVMTEFNPEMNAAPKPDAHTKADETLHMLVASHTDEFHLLTMAEAGGPVYPGGLVGSNKVQVIFEDGTMMSGETREFTWSKSTDVRDIVYWRRM